MSLQIEMQDRSPQIDCYFNTLSGVGRENKAIEYVNGAILSRRAQMAIMSFLGT